MYDKIEQIIKERKEKMLQTKNGFSQYHKIDEVGKEELTEKEMLELLENGSSDEVEYLLVVLEAQKNDNNFLRNHFMKIIHQFPENKSYSFLQIVINKKDMAGILKQNWKQVIEHFVKWQIPYMIEQLWDMPEMKKELMKNLNFIYDQCDSTTYLDLVKVVELEPELKCSILSHLEEMRKKVNGYEYGAILAEVKTAFEGEERDKLDEQDKSRLEKYDFAFLLHSMGLSLQMLGKIAKEDGYLHGIEEMFYTTFQGKPFRKERGRKAGDTFIGENGYVIRLVKDFSDRKDSKDISKSFVRRRIKNNQGETEFAILIQNQYERVKEEDLSLRERKRVDRLNRRLDERQYPQNREMRKIICPEPEESILVEGIEGNYKKPKREGGFVIIDTGRG